MEEYQCFLIFHFVLFGMSFLPNKLIMLLEKTMSCPSQTATALVGVTQSCALSQSSSPLMPVAMCRREQLTVGLQSFLQPLGFLESLLGNLQEDIASLGGSQDHLHIQGFAKKPDRTKKDCYTHSYSLLQQNRHRERAFSEGSRRVPGAS